MSAFRFMRQLVASCMFLLGAGAASAATITIGFDKIDESGDIVIESYSESGFVFTSVADDVFPHMHPGSGSLWLHSSVGSSPYLFRREGGGLFDFLGFDYAGGDSVFIADNGATFEILGEMPMTHFTLPDSFRNVSTIHWHMNTLDPDDPFGEQWGYIDNIVMNVSPVPVPEPAQAGMLGLGLAAMLAARRRARRKQAPE